MDELVCITWILYRTNYNAIWNAIMIAHTSIDAGSLILIESISIDHIGTARHVASRYVSIAIKGFRDWVTIFFFHDRKRERVVHCAYISCTSLFYSFVFPISVPEINYTVGDLFERFIEFSNLFFPRKRESFMSSLDRELQNYNHPIRP